MVIGLLEVLGRSLGGASGYWVRLRSLDCIWVTVSNEINDELIRGEQKTAGDDRL